MAFECVESTCCCSYCLYGELFLFLFFITVFGKSFPLDFFPYSYICYGIRIRVSVFVGCLPGSRSFWVLDCGVNLTLFDGRDAEDQIPNLLTDLIFTIRIWHLTSIDLEVVFHLDSVTLSPSVSLFA